MCCFHFESFPHSIHNVVTVLHQFVHLSLVDEVTEGGTITLLVLVSVTSIVLAGYFVTRGKEELDFDWEEDDEF